MINSAHPPAEIGQPIAVDASRPDGMAGYVVLFGPFALEHRLGLAVAALLFPVGAHRVASVMPNERGRAEPKAPALLLQSPADIHVIPGDVKLRIETADRLQRNFAKRH